MDSLVRFHALMHHDLNHLDRIPIDYWATKEVDQRLYHVFNCQNREQLLDKLDVDFRYIEGPKYIGPELIKHSDGSENDIWGVPRKKIFFGEKEYRGNYESVTKSPLQFANSLSEIENYAFWPNPNWYDYSVIAEQCDNVHAKKRVVMFMGDRLNRIAQLKPMMYLRGVTQTLRDIARKNHPIFDAVLEKIRSFYLEYLKNILHAANGKIDVIVTGDDFGQQDLGKKWGLYYLYGP